MTLSTNAFIVRTLIPSTGPETPEEKDRPSRRTSEALAVSGTA